MIYRNYSGYQVHGSRLVGLRSSYFVTAQVVRFTVHGSGLRVVFRSSYFISLTLNREPLNCEPLNREPLNREPRNFEPE